MASLVPANRTLHGNAACYSRWPIQPKETFVSTLGKFFILAAAGAVAYRYVARASASRSPEQADRRLRDDIQRHLAASFPGAEHLEVVVNAGDVSLRGEMPAERVEAALESVLALPGVRHIHNRVTPLEAGLPRSTMQDAMQPA